MAVISWRIKNAVTWEMGAFTNCFVQGWRNLGILSRILDPEGGVVGVFGGIGGSFCDKNDVECKPARPNNNMRGGSLLNGAGESMQREG